MFTNQKPINQTGHRPISTPTSYLVTDKEKLVLTIKMIRLCTSVNYIMHKKTLQALYIWDSLTK